MPNPSRPWLRLWDCTLDLPKAQKLTGEQFKGWINLLMLANRQNDRGRLPDASEIAFALRVSQSKVAPLISVLVAAKLIDMIGSDLVIHDWQTWQPAEKTNSERAREWRENQNGQSLSERSASAQDERSASAQDERSIGEESREEKKEEPRKRAMKPPSIFLAGRPDDVPEKEWADFHAVRKHKRALDNQGSLDHVLLQIEKLRLDDQVIVECVRQSIRSSWTDVYAIKKSFNGTYSGSSVAPRKKHWKDKSESELTPEERIEADEWLRQERINANAARRAK